MLRDHPLLTLLGRRGRGAVVDALRAEPERTWNIRDLARVADVPVITASRAVRELEGLGVVDGFRPGRDKVVRWEPESAVAQALLPFVVPDLRGEGARAAVAALQLPPGARAVRWTMPDDDPADPLCPTRIAIICRDDDEDRVLDAIGPALDAAGDAGWPRPDITAMPRGMLGDDAVSLAVRDGAPI